uniref:DUF1833 domain-containing protein n=2 Tax=Caenorhabditis tropicalis TaxID=1561998 RepID=A0A1I7TKP6_9PELO
MKHIQIAQFGGIPAFIRNIVEPDNRDTVYQVTLHPAGQREKHPPVQSVEFKIRVIDAQDRDILSPIRYIHPPGFPSRNVFNAGYSTPERGPIRDFLNGIIGNKMLEHLEFDVQTTIIFNVKSFLSMEYLNQLVGKPMPIDLNFRFKLLTNQSTHDFLLKTTTQLSFPCNKEALYVASPFFRKNLTPEMTCFQLGVEFLESIEVAITWLLTETYHPPFKITPELANEIVKLIERIVPRGPNQRHILGSIERHCFDELIQVL